jgi:hypothetical protein
MWTADDRMKVMVSEWIVATRRGWVTLFVVLQTMRWW